MALFSALNLSVSFKLCDAFRENFFGAGIDTGLAKPTLQPIRIPSLRINHPESSKFALRLLKRKIETNLVTQW